MGMNVTITPEAGYLRVVTSGDFSLEEAERTFLDVVYAVAEHGSQKVLVDGRAIAGEPATIERFYFGEFAAQKCHEHLYTARFEVVPKFAYVLREPVLDPERFGETVARNRGMIVNAFDNVEAALAWLGVAGTGDAD